MTEPIRFSRGRSVKNTRTRQVVVATFAEFIAEVGKVRAPTKDGASYICGPMGGNGARSAANAQPCAFLVLDFDAIPPDLHPELRVHMMRYTAMAWQTHSSTPENLRERIIIELDRAATRDEHLAIGRVLQGDLHDVVGRELDLDKTGFRPEQPAFVPPLGAQIATFDGEPLRVDAFLAAAAAMPSEPPLASALAIGKDCPVPCAIGRGTGLDFRRVNDAAMVAPQAWVPALFSDAKASGGGFRVSSKALGRELQEDLSIMPAGIVDFGLADQGDPRQGKRTPIDLVIEHGARVGVRSPVEALHWIAAQLGLPLARPALQRTAAAAGPDGENGPLGDDAPPMGGRTENKAPRIQFPEVTFGDVGTAPPAAQSWYVAGLVPAGQVTLFTGHGGAGKSTCTLMMGVDLAEGREFFGHATKQATVLYFSAEDPAPLLRLRLAKICRDTGVDPAKLAERLRVIDATELDAALYAERRVAGVRSGGTTPTYAALREYVEAHAIDVLILDNSSDLFDADEIVRQLVRGFIRSLAQLVRATGGAVVLLAHVDKQTSRAGKMAGTEAYSGSTALHNSVRSRLFLLEKEPGLLELQHQKSNLGPRQPTMLLEWPAGGLPRLAVVTDPATAYRDARQALLRLLYDFGQQGKRPSTSKNSGAAAHHLFGHDPRYPKRLRLAEVERVFEDAETTGLIFRDQVRSSDRKTREVWTLTARGEAMATGAGPLFVAAAA